MRVLGACASGAAVLACMFVETDGLLAVALGLVALSWAMACYASDLAGYAAVAVGFLALATFAALGYFDVSGWFTLVTFTFLAFAQLVPSRIEAPPRALVRRVSRVTGVTGLVTVLIPVMLAALTPLGVFPSSPAWPLIDGVMVTVALAVFGGWLLAAGVFFGVEAAYYAGYAATALAVMYQFQESGLERPEFYTTVIGLYVVAMGYLFARLGPDRKVPRGTDLLGTAVMLGIPAVLAVRATGVEDAWTHAIWAFGLSLVAVLAGVAGRVRVYFFGGVATIVWVSLLYSFEYLVQFWWLLLGIIGVAMLVIALTWERQRMVVADTRSWLRRSFEGWR